MNMHDRLTKSCFRQGCELHDRCKLYKAEFADMQIYPQHSGENCDWFVPIGTSRWGHGADSEENG